MKKFYLLLLLAALFATFSCAHEEHVIVNKETIAEQNLIIDGKVSLSRAMSNADFVFKNINAISAKSRKVKSVDILTTTNSKIISTRSSSQNEQDIPLAYIVNYENNNGFAILAADTKLPPVISLGDEGNFNTEGFVNFIQKNGTTRSYEGIDPAQLVQYALVNNSLLLPPINNISPQIQGVDTTIIFKCSPLVRTKWGQSDPYNYYAPNDPYANNQKSKAGCVPVAGAQTLAALCYHHNWRPTTQLSDIYSIDWDFINRMILNDYISFQENDHSARALAVASLIRAIGEDVNANYSYGGTGSNNIKLVDTYEKLGLTNVLIGSETLGDRITRSDLFDMIINKNFPVTTQAIDSSIQAGHSFILDGWLRLEYSLLNIDYAYSGNGQMTTNINNTQYNFDLVHVNMGSNGKCDGYYLPDAFDLTTDKYHEYAEENDQAQVNIYVFDLNVAYMTYDKN